MYKSVDKWPSVADLYIHITCIHNGWTNGHVRVEKHYHCYCDVCFYVALIIVIVVCHALLSICISLHGTVSVFTTDLLLSCTSRLTFSQVCYFMDIGIPHLLKDLNMFGSFDL